ncbi:MAG: exopolysaccharide transport family protein [Pseudomonadota bacterium]
MSVNGQSQSFETVDEVVDLKSIWVGLRRQSVLFLGVGMTTMLAFLGYIILAEDLYTAETSIVIEPDNENFINDNGARIAGDGTADAKIDTEVELLRSRAMATRVLRRLATGSSGTTDPADRMDFLDRGLSTKIADVDGPSTRTDSPNTDKTSEPSLRPLQEPGVSAPSLSPVAEKSATPPNPKIGVPLREQADSLTPKVSDELILSENSAEIGPPDLIIPAADIQEMRDNIEVERVGQTMLIKVRAINSDPVKAAEIANIYAEEFILEKVEAQFSALRLANQWIDARLETLKTQIRESESESARLRALEGFVDAGATGPSIAEQRIARLAADLREAKTEYTVQSARYSAAQRVAQTSSSSELASLNLTSPLVDELRRRLTLSEQQVAELETRYGNRHPKLVSAREEKSRLNAQLKDELKRIVVSLAGDLGIIRSRIRALEQELEAEQAELAARSNSEVRLQELSRDLQAPTAVYEALLSRKGELNQRDRLLKADARIVARARTPDAPSRPRRKLLLAGGFVVAFLLAAGAAYTSEMIDGRIRNTSDIRLQFGDNAPVVVLPKINIGGLLFKPDIGKIAAKYVLSNGDSLYREAVRELIYLLKSTEIGRAKQPISIAFASVFGEEGNSTVAFCFASMLKAAGNDVLYLDCSGSRSKQFFKARDDARLTDASGAGGGSRNLLLTARSALMGKGGLSDDVTSSAEEQSHELTTFDSIQVDNCDGSSRLKGVETQIPVSFHGLSGGVEVARLSGENDLDGFDNFDAGDLSQTIDELKTHFDFVIIDAPGLITKSEANLIAGVADAVAVTLEWCKTTRAAAQVAVQRLVEVDAKVLGFVLNKADARQSYYFRPEDRNFFYRSKFRRGGVFS